MKSNPNEKSNMVNNSHSTWFVRFGYVVLTVIGCALVTSLCMSFIGVYAQIANQHILTSPAPDLVLDVVYPRSLLFDDSSASIVVSLTAADSMAFTQPITVALVVPPSIVMSGTESNEWVFDEGNGRYQQAPFIIQNTGILQGLLPPYQTQILTLTNALNSSPTPLSIRVETIAAATIRQFMLGLLQDKSPLLLAIAALLPIAALLLQHLQRQEEREEKELTFALHQFELKTKQEQKRTDTEKQKQETLLLIPSLRSNLSQSNIVEIQQAWLQINPLILNEVLSTPERDWLSSLVYLSLKGDVPSDWEVWKKWPYETAGALLSAQTYIRRNPIIYQDFYRKAPLKKIESSIKDQLNQLLDIDDLSSPIPLQNWTQEIFVRDNLDQESSLSQTRLYNMLAPDPLAHDRTENEETNLFIRDGFWFGHPAYSVMANAVQMQVVAGPIGCGRTALAKGLCYNESRWSRYFWHYRPLYSGLRDVSTLCIDLVEQLLQYVITHPTLLSPLQEQQRHLMAGIFVDSLPKQQVLARLEMALTAKPWLGYATKEQQTVWQNVGDTELARLLQAVESTTINPPLPELQWAKTLFTSFQALNFKGVRLVLDCASGSSEAITALCPTLQEWQQSGLITTLFVPNGADTNITGAARVTLTWSQTQLEALFAHRLLRLANFPLPKAPFASDSVYNSFMAEASAGVATPRKLVHLWQLALANLGEEEAISMADVRKAANILRKRDEEIKSTESGREYNLERLQSLMDEHFNDEETRSLCMAASVDYDNLSGSNKHGKIRELILLMSRSGRLPELVEKCQEERPFINWG